MRLEFAAYTSDCPIKIPHNTKQYKAAINVAFVHGF